MGEYLPRLPRRGGGGAISRLQQDGGKEKEAGAEHLPRGLQRRVALGSIISGPGTTLIRPRLPMVPSLVGYCVKELIMIILNARLDLNGRGPDECGSRAGGTEGPRAADRVFLVQRS